MAEQAENDR